MKKIGLFIAACLISVSSHAQNDDSVTIRRIADDILIHGKAYDDLRYLCKKVGARLSGSSNAQKSVEATAQMLRDAGADTVYLQPCMVPHWVRGEKEQGIIQWGKSKKALSVCALGMSVGTPGTGLKAEVIEVADFDELKKLGEEKVKGKIIFFNYHMKPELIFGGYGDAVRYRVAGPVEAAKLGAVAIMIRSVTYAFDNNPHTGTTKYDSSVNKIPAMACSTIDADWLHELFKKEKKVELFMKMNCEKLPDVLSYNVVGEIRGSEFPGEIITAGGHLDSWDLAEGAHDDGSGCVQSIQVIRTIKALGIHPKRTIRAVMFMNEENGLVGGNKYAELAGLNKENHLFAIESDAGGFGVEMLGLSGKPEQETKVRSWLPLFKPYGIADLPDGGGGADIGPLKKFGTFMCGVNPGSQRYFDFHHAPNDTFENVNKRELEMGGVGMTAIIYLVDKYGL
jgi:carboxypeptidase Q